MSAMDIFKVAVAFSAIDGLSGPMANMARQMGILGQHSAAVQKQLDRFRNMAVIGGAMTAVGIGLLHHIEGGVQQAGEFLTKMTIIRDVTGSTAAQMERIQKVISSSSGKTIFNVMETSDFAQKLATSGMSGKQVETLLPIFTAYAEVQKLGKGSSPELAITQAISAAHMVGAYTPKQLSEFIDKFNKASFMQPGSTTEFFDTFKYLAPRTQRLMSTNDQLQLAALSNRVGFLGSMGGTSASNMILRSISGLSGGIMGKRQVKALHDLGLDHNIYGANGKFLGLNNFIKQVYGAGERIKSDKQRTLLFSQAFGLQGVGLANILGSSRGMEQLKQIVAQMKSMKSIWGMQSDTNAGPAGQILQLKTNIDNLQLGVFIQMAKALNPIFHYLNDIVSKVMVFVDAHPMINKILADFELIAAAVLLVTGPLLVFVGAIGYLATSGVLGAGLVVIGDALAGLLWPLTALTVGCTVLYRAWTQDWGGIQEKTRQVFHNLKKWFHDYTTASEISSDKVQKTWSQHHRTMMKTDSIFLMDVKGMWNSIATTGKVCSDALSTVFKPVFEYMKSSLTTIVDKMGDIAHWHAQFTTDVLTGWFGNSGPDLAPQIRQMHKMYPKLSTDKLMDMVKQNNGLNGWSSDYKDWGLPQAAPVQAGGLGRIHPHAAGKHHGGHGDVHFHPGAVTIHISQKPGQSGRQLAREVYNQLGQLARDKSYATGLAVNSAWSLA